MLKWIFNNTLNSVWFGILMMLGVATFVAVGSGFPEVREYFEMDELAFFNAWPFKVLMALLVANLVTVTFLRIPFTPPRYGVWMIHAGIVILIYGMAYYYSFKEEGLAFIPKGQTVSTYYDKWERSLYTRVNDINTNDEHVMLSLPRFKQYQEGDRRISGSDLKNLEPVVIRKGTDGKEQVTALYQVMGLKDPIKFDVVGYWPYGEITSNYIKANGGGGKTAIKVEAFDNENVLRRRIWMVADDASGGHHDLEELEIEHRESGDDAVQAITEAVGKIHQLQVTAGGENRTMFVELGRSYKVGRYEIAVEEFDPAWVTMQGDRVELLTLMVTPPAATGIKPFRRQVIPGRETVTDWLLNVEGAGPMGKRQTEPLDKQLITRYTFNDALRLLPVHGRFKRIFWTTPSKTFVISTSFSRESSVVEEPTGKGEMKFGQNGPRLTFERVENVRRVDSVVVTPREKRNRQAAAEGLKQVLAVRVTCGNWSELVYVPFAQWALTSPWEGGSVKIPGTDLNLQLALGMRSRLIAPHPRAGNPAAVKLDDFKIVSYGGASQSLMQRDFRSFLTITEGNGEERKGVAHMNNPVYFGGSPISNIGDTYWTLFQASWDPNGQRFTVLGVGNRPGVWIMTAGSVLMTVGLLYAFYVKPLIISRMKKRAIEEAKAKGKVIPVGVAG